TNVARSFSVAGQQYAATNVYLYGTNGVDLLENYFYDATGSIPLARYSYGDQHQLLTATNAVGDVTGYSYNAYGQVTGASLPSGLTRTNFYASSGPSWLTTTTDLEIGRASTFTYSFSSNGAVRTVTDSRGLTITNTSDQLERLTRIEDPRGYIAMTYSSLDLSTVTDR